ncbi:kinase/pyrophosphorylase, partial [Rhodanobacter sp. OR444]
MQRTVFFISDSTGITAETIGNSILAQFEDVRFDKHRLPFTDNAHKAETAALRIKTNYAQTGQRPIVVNTMADRALCEIVAASGALMLDVFAPFIGPLEDELGTKRTGLVNRSHGLVDFDKYEARINATNYALTHDDGIDVNYAEADLILVGVSRSGKTPTCLYMALHYGVRAANYPLTDEDLEKLELPSRLCPYRDRLYGLTIDPVR